MTTLLRVHGSLPLWSSTFFYSVQRAAISLEERNPWVYFFLFVRLFFLTYLKATLCILFNLKLIASKSSQCYSDLKWSQWCVRLSLSESQSVTQSQSVCNFSERVASQCDSITLWQHITHSMSCKWFVLNWIIFSEENVFWFSLWCPLTALTQLHCDLQSFLKATCNCSVP